MFGGRVVGSLGEFDFRRIFAMIDTGEFTPWGTRAFVSASNAKNDNPFNNYGKVDKQQYNAKIYQPLGSNGDFFSIAGHYNQNRNNFFGSVRLRTDAGQRCPTPSRPNATSANMTSTTRASPTSPQAGVADSPAPAPTDGMSSCGTEFDRRYNPSNTGNIRINSRFTLTDAADAHGRSELSST